MEWSAVSNMLIGIFYGSTDGNTERVAHALREELARAFSAGEHSAGAHDAAPPEVEVLDVAEFYIDEMEEFDHLILGIPTWNVGQLQSDWEAVLDELDELDLTGKKVAIFGLGDQVGYANTFADAMFFLANKVRSRGAQLVGRWSTDGYAFENSWAVEDGQFLGLVLDEHNQEELTPMRITLWATQLKLAFAEQ